MLCIHLKNRDPYFCLAAEEYSMKNFSEDVFMLWQSEDTVVVGKHQNALAEINYPYVHKNNIKVARRISGGGTVFHDKGNVNFCFIQNVDSPSEISFRRFVEPILDALSKLGINAVTSGRNDLLIEGKKISGNAEHIFKNRVLHHGTLLFNSSLNKLGQSIKVTPGKFQGKAVQSNRSEVTNILPFLKNKLTINEFNSFLMNYQIGRPGSSSYAFDEREKLAIQKLADEKFTTWEWNFGYSPKYTFHNVCLIKGKILKSELKVERGYINGAVISGDYYSNSQSEWLNKAFIGMKHTYNDLRTKIQEIDAVPTAELVYAFF